MFYELPAIKLDLYTDVEGTMVRSPLFSRTIKTYNPTFPLDQQCSICISMKDVPTNCYLFVTPIFDNNAIEARNELIRNGIEDGQLWTTKTNTFNILLSYEDNDSVPTNTITQQPPISFTSDGTSLFSWSMLGNGSQTGTPAPDAPVMPTFCGVRTGNLWNEDYTGISVDLKYVAVYVGDGSFTLSTDTPDYSRNAPLFLLSGNVTSGASTPVNGVYNGVSRTAASSNGYITIAFRQQSESISPITHNTMLNLGSTALPYEPYGWSEKITCAGQTVPVYLGQTQTVRRIKKLVLTGDEFWRDYNGNIWSDAVDSDSMHGMTCICTHLDSQRNSGIYISNGSTRLKVYASSVSSVATTAEEWVQYLQHQYANGTPVTIWYILATPETGIVNEPLAKIGDYADELYSEDTTVTIPTIKGQNTLTVEGDLPPSSMTITGNIK